MLPPRLPPGTRTFLHPRAMYQTHASPSPRYRWVDLVALSGDVAGEWMEEYRRHAPVAAQAVGSLDPLRRGDLDTGRRMLERTWDDLCSADVSDASVRCVLERWYYGVLGYYHYCRSAFDEADRAMLCAHEVMERAFGERDFLLALADDAFELRVHRARVARSRCRWDEMREHATAALGMREGRVPYYVLADGRRIWVSTILDFLRSLTITDEVRPAVAHLLDDAERERQTERAIREVYRLSGFVIQHP